MIIKVKLYFFNFFFGCLDGNNNEDIVDKIDINDNKGKYFK